MSTNPIACTMTLKPYNSCEPTFQVSLHENCVSMSVNFSEMYEVLNDNLGTIKYEGPGCPGLVITVSTEEDSEGDQWKRTLHYTKGGLNPPTCFKKSASSVKISIPTDEMPTLSRIGAVLKSVTLPITPETVEMWYDIGFIDEGAYNRLLEEDTATLTQIIQTINSQEVRTMDNLEAAAPLNEAQVEQFL